MKQLFDLGESHRNVLLSFTVADRMDVKMLTLVDNQQIQQKAISRTLRCQAHALSVVCVDANTRNSLLRAVRERKEWIKHLLGVYIIGSLPVARE